MWASSTTMKSMSSGQVWRAGRHVFASSERMKVRNDHVRRKNCSPLTPLIAPSRDPVSTPAAVGCPAEGPAREAVEDVADGRVVECTVECAANYATGCENEGAPLAEGKDWQGYRARSCLLRRTSRLPRAGRRRGNSS